MPSMFSNPDNLTTTGYSILDANGDRILDYDVNNVRTDGTIIKIGTVTSETYNETTPINYLGGTLIAPSDIILPAIIASFITSSKDIGAFIVVFFAIGMVALLLAFIGLLLFKKRAALKYTSFTVHLIMLTCLSIGLIDMILVLEIPTAVSCSASAAIAPFMFSLYYGILFVKALRIYSKFYAFEPIEEMNSISFRHIWPGILFIIPNILMWISWITVDPPLPTIAKIGPGSYMWVCSSKVGGIGNGFILGIVGYNAFIVFINLYLAYKSRHIDLHHKEAKMIRTSVMNLGFIFLILVPILLAEGALSQTQLLIRAVGVFFITMVNVATLYYYKFYASRLTKDQKIGKEPKPEKPGIKYKIPKTMSGLYEHIQPAVVFLKAVGTFDSIFEEPSKTVLIPASPFCVWACGLRRTKLGSLHHLIDEVGKVWIYTPTTAVSLRPIANCIIHLHIGSTLYQIVFEKEEMCKKWTSYFELWVVGKEGTIWNTETPTLKSRPVDE